MTSVEKYFQCSSLLDVHKRLLDTYEVTQNKNKLSVSDEFLLRKNHKFLWNDTGSELSWDEQLARKYYNKLFKEFCICDLSRFKENQVALRWRTKNEVISGKGQFICAEKKCNVGDHLRTWEVNFCYVEEQQKKNALVKIKLCSNCSVKLNYHSKKREIKKAKKNLRTITKGKHQKINKSAEKSVSSPESSEPGSSNVNLNEINEDSLWIQSNEQIEVKSREDEMEDYLNDLLC
ncbi:hypothetical protein HHI36_010377 [Cryptolaemus montrouzieri]|uniref:Protein FRA10AC1 n=1 Tax=Cryptolaemus montrouzieri TaxID=559131 RepID=A0ABD2MIL4_9CUCU